MRSFWRRLAEWQFGAVLLLVVSAGFAILALYVGLDTARVIRDVDPDAVVEMRVERIVQSTGWPRELRAQGWIPDEASMKSVRVANDDIRILQRDAGRLAVYATGAMDEPYVTKRWYDDQPFLRLGDVLLPWHYIVTAAFAALVYWLVAHRRHELRRRPAPPAPADIHPAWSGIDPRYAPLVERLERDAAADPAAYRRRVVAFASLGYVFLGGVLATIAAAIAGVIAAGLAARSGILIKLAIPLFALAAVILRAMWVRVPPPSGWALTAAEYPALFAMIERLRAKLRGPQLHDVLLVEEINAAIVQRARLGALGWQRNTLIIGLPLLVGMSPAEFESVVAHEYGHLAGAHGRLASWVYRVRRTWSQLAHHLATRARWGAFLFRRFFGWYAPWFSAYSFVLARANEYAADRLAATTTSARIVADALARVTLLARYVDREIWPTIVSSSRHDAVPPRAYHALTAALRDGWSSHAGEMHLAAGAAHETGLDDTHPSLSDRIRALGQTLSVPATPGVRAADVFLGDRLAGILEAFDTAWQARVCGAWQEAYATAEAERVALEALDVRALAGPLDREAQWEQAVLTERVRGRGAALAIVDAIAAADPVDAPAQFALGRLRLAQGNDAGVGIIERAMALDDDAVIPGCALLAEFLIERGRRDEARKFRVRGEAAQVLRRHAAAERSTLDGASMFEPHGLTSEALASIRTVLENCPPVRRVWLVRRVVRHRPDLPVHIVVARFRWFSRRRRPSLAAELVQSLAQCGLPGQVWVLPADVLNARLVLRAIRVANSRIALPR